MGSDDVHTARDGRPGGSGPGTADARGTARAGAGAVGSAAGTAGSGAGTAGSGAGTAGSGAGTAGSAAGTAGSAAGTAGSAAGTAGSGAGTSGSGAGTAGSGAGTVVVRAAVLDDAEAIAHVHAASWRETYGRFVADPSTDPWFDAGRRVRMWQTNLSDGAFTTVVAVAGRGDGVAAVPGGAAPDGDGPDPGSSGTGTSSSSGSGVIGFAAVRAADEDDAVRPEELTMLYLLAEAHGSGAGQALLDAVLADRPASLWVAADNPRAHAFYRRNGFVPDGAESTFGPIGATVRLVR